MACVGFRTTIIREIATLLQLPVDDNVAPCRSSLHVGGLIGNAVRHLNDIGVCRDGKVIFSYCFFDRHVGFNGNNVSRCRSTSYVRVSMYECKCRL